MSHEGPIPPLLQVDGLVTELTTPRGPVRPVDRVSFELPVQGTLGIVGESGSGKSMLAMSILGLLPRSTGRVIAGGVRYRGQELVGLAPAEMRKLRGRSLGLVFQEPMSALNPVFTIGSQLTEPMSLHLGLSRRAARQRALELLASVGIAAPEDRIDAYPHELSGGMRQRVMIAMAISCDPQVLIADEPTTALDVTVQAQVLDLLARLQAERAMGIVVITHDLGVVAEFVDHVMVMYAGRAVEYASTAHLFDNPLHPYTRGLLRSVPSHGQRRLATIDGVVPDLAHLPGGCRFRSRCPDVRPRCAQAEPEPVALSGGRQVACFVAQDTHV